MPSPDEVAQLTAQFPQGQIPDDPSQDSPGPPMPVPPIPPDQMAPSSGPVYNARIAGLESNSNPNAKNPLSTASGQYQITDGSHENTIANHPELKGQDKNSPAVMDAYTEDNRAALAKMIGREPNALDMRTAHLMGATGAARFLLADPNAPAYRYASPQAIQANPSVFFNPDKSAKTIQEVYASAAQKMGVDPKMPPPGPDATGPTQFANTGAHPDNMATRNPGSYQVADSGKGIPPPPVNPPQNTPGIGPGAPQSPGNRYPSFDSQMAGHNQDINAYIAGQPGMFAKLQALQDAYKQAATPTWQDKITDALSSMNQLSAVAQANMAATAGGVANNSNPNARDFVDALKSKQAIDVAARQARLDQAKTGYDMGSNMLSAQDASQRAGLALTGQQADKRLDYGATTQKNSDEYNLQAANRQLELAKFGQAQQVQLNDYIDKAVPNENARSQVRTELAAVGNPSAGYATNTKIVDDIVTRLRTGTPASSDYQPEMPAVGSGPPKPQVGTVAIPPQQLTDKVADNQFVQWTDQNTGAPIKVPFNNADPNEAANARALLMQHKGENAGIIDPKVPLPTQITNTNSGGGAGGSGGATMSLGEQHTALAPAENNIQTALKILDVLPSTGKLTDSPMGLDMAQKIKSITGIDYSGVSLHALYGKLMSQIQNTDVMTAMKQAGISRITQQELGIFLKGYVGSDYPKDVAQTALKHALDAVQWSRKRVDAEIDARDNAQKTGNTGFNPDKFQRDFNNSPGNAQPVWDIQPLIDGSTKPLATPSPQPNLRAGMTGTIDGKPVVHDGNHWVTQ